MVLISELNGKLRVLLLNIHLCAVIHQSLFSANTIYRIHRRSLNIYTCLFFLCLDELTVVIVVFIQFVGLAVHVVTIVYQS